MTNPDRSELFTPDELAVRLDEWANCLDKSQWDLRSDMRCAAIHLRRLASSDSGVKVRELEWEKSEGNLSGQIVWSSGDPWVFWIVKDADKPSYVWCENFNIEGWCPASPVRGVFDALEAAKAAAQADYETRIRSALVEVPAVKGEPEPVASARISRLAADLVVSGWTAGDHGIELAKRRAERKLLEFACDEIERHMRSHTAPPADAGMRWRHKARGSTYTEIGIGRMQSEHWRDPDVDGDYDTQSVDMREVTIYRADSDGTLWVRPREEFEDGRFEAFTAPGATTKSDGGSRTAPESCPNCFNEDDCANVDICNAVNDVYRPSDPSSTRSDVTALADIAKERRRQRDVEGWTVAHDDGHDAGEMASAAACYALSATGIRGDDGAMLRFWPWDDHWWKPTNRRRDLIKAGALIVAEIERLDRLDQFEIRRK